MRGGLTGVLGLAILMAAQPASSQEPQPAAITGRVVDSRGPLAGAIVTVTADGVRRTAVTDIRGDYRIDDLPALTYRVQVELSPTFIMHVTAVPAEPGRTTPHNVELKLVAGAASLADYFERSQFGAIIGRVTDSSGGLLPGVTIAVAGSANRRVTTNARGEYRMSGLSAGKHLLAGTLAGFRRTAVFVTVTAGGLTTGDLELRTGIIGTDAGLIDYVWPGGGVLGALRQADLVAHIRITTTLGTRLLGRDASHLATEHAAAVLAVVKTDRRDGDSEQSIQFVQSYAGVVVEEGTRYVGAYAVYEPGQSFVAFFRRGADGALYQAYGPSFTLPVSDRGRVTLPSSPVPNETLPPDLTSEMSVDDFVAALRKLLAGG
jgi:hypothetical protein